MHGFKIGILALGLVGIADTALILSISGGINLGTLLPGLAGSILTIWAFMTPQTGLDLAFMREFSLKSAGGGIVLLGAFSFLVIQLLILSHAFSRDTSRTDWCIVLGAGLRGEQPSLTLRNRLHAAAQYLEKHPEAQVVVSGGQGPGETLTEAEAMRRFLVDAGIAPGRIHLEDRALSTVQNLRFARAVISEKGGDPSGRINIISSDFHLFRVRMLARRLGMKTALIAAPTPWYLLPNTCIREYFALIKSFMVDR